VINILLLLVAWLLTSQQGDAAILSKTRVWKKSSLSFEVHQAKALQAPEPRQVAEGVRYDLASGSTLAAEGLEASSALNSLKLGHQLAGEEAASVFTAEGKLTSEAIQGSRQIIAPGELGNPAIPKGFGKYSTETFHSPSGPFQSHFYMNPTNGEVFYGLDFKAVFNNGISPYGIGGY